jgi:hypothetical protein
MNRVLEMGLKDETVLSVGMMSLAIGILIGRFTHFEVSGFSVSDFVEGVLIGVSLVMNLFYLAKKARDREPSLLKPRS